MSNIVNLPTYEQVEAVKTKVEETGGLVVGTDGKKYRAVMDKNMAIGSTFKDWTINVASNFNYSDDKYTYLFNNYATSITVVDKLTQDIITSISTRPSSHATPICMPTVSGGTPFGMACNDEYMFLAFRDAGSGNSGFSSRLVIIDKNTLTVKNNLAMVLDSRQAMGIFIAGAQLYIYQLSNNVVYSYLIDSLISGSANSPIATKLGMVNNYNTDTRYIWERDGYVYVASVNGTVNLVVSKYLLSEFNKGVTTSPTLIEHVLLPFVSGDGFGINGAEMNDSLIFIMSKKLYELKLTDLSIVNSHTFNTPILSSNSIIKEEKESFTVITPLPSFTYRLMLYVGIYSRNGAGNSYKLMNIEYPYGYTTKTDTQIDPIPLLIGGNMYMFLNQTSRLWKLINTYDVLGYEEVL